MTDKKSIIKEKLSRRDFLKFCTAVTATLGLNQSAVSEVAEALLTAQRPPVLWLHFAECTGCSEALLRSSAPYFEELIMDIISLDYHETLMAGAGHTVEDILTNAANLYQGEFFCVVEGSIPTAANGVYGMIGGRTMHSIAQEIIPKAKAVIAYGTCSAYGGLAAAEPNPTGAMGVADALPGLQPPLINVTGCPPNPINLVSVIADYLLNGTLPTLDNRGRPNFAYSKAVHVRCPYNLKANKHKCQTQNGCKGRKTGNNCPTIGYNEGTSFPMKAGHPCIGCSEPNFWDVMTPFYQ